ncbi:MAG: pirin family protein [Brevefilum sp.]|nr:pirin family protein [Brevefilum sp.]
MSSSDFSGKECAAMGSNELTFTAHPNRQTHLGDLNISRALPIRERRMVGPWCFLDRFGPLTFADEKPMAVPPHPHIGLQTVTWLLEGEILHTDSLNSEAVVRPGGVNIMTAGRGIAHAEETPTQNSGRLSGIQLWTALPDQHRDTAASFTSLEQVPRVEVKGGSVQLIAGTLNDVTTPAPYFSEILGAEVQVHPRQTVSLPLQDHFEHAVLLLEGDGTLEKQPVEQNTLYYLGACRESLDITSHTGCKLLLIGGVPFPEKILMWWNFVARTPEEIRQARDDWEAQRRFGAVTGTHLERLSAPDLARFARPNPVS